MAIADFRIEGRVVRVEVRQGDRGARQIISVKVEPQLARTRDGSEVSVPGRTLRARVSNRMRESSCTVSVGDRVVLVSTLAAESPPRAATIIHRTFR